MSKFLKNQKPEPVNYNAFRDDDDVVNDKSNVKLDNSKSMFAGKQFRSTNFDEGVDNYFKKDNDFKQKAFQLATNYKKAIQDKTLVENKGLIGKDEEKALISELIKLANEINNDQSQPEGIGSIGLCSLLLQVCLYQRDQLNELLYRVQKLESKDKK